MSLPKVFYYQAPDLHRSVVREDIIEYGFIGKLQAIKYEYRPDITDCATLEQNLSEKFEARNRVHLTDGEFSRLLDEIITPDVFTAAKLLRQINAFTLQRMIFDGEHLSDLMAPFDLGWKARTQAELSLMADLHPLFTKRAQGRDISGLSAHKQ